MKVPRGMDLIGIALPIFMSTPSPATTVSPTFRSTGARIYLFSPSTYVKSAILQERFGSYSIAVTLPGTHLLSLLKSMILYALLCPPPIHLEVTLPYEFLPPVLFKGKIKDFSGSTFVISSKDNLVNCLMPGDVGLYVFNGILSLRSIATLSVA